VKALINAGGDAATRAAFLLMPDISNGYSCLHAASFFGHVTVVLFLLSLSCPGLVDLRDRSGRTALELAVAAGQTAAAEAIRAASGRPAPPRPS
jgi:ankyrin repeat protein